jgi:hypothetical protein
MDCREELVLSCSIPEHDSAAPLGLATLSAPDEALVRPWALTYECHNLYPEPDLTSYIRSCGSPDVESLLDSPFHTALLSNYSYGIV